MECFFRYAKQAITRRIEWAKFTQEYFLKRYAFLSSEDLNEQQQRGWAFAVCSCSVMGEDEGGSVIREKEML